MLIGKTTDGMCYPNIRTPYMQSIEAQDNYIYCICSACIFLAKECEETNMNTKDRIKCKSLESSFVL